MDSRSSTDCELLLSWRDGDRSAGAELLRRHWGAVRRYFQRRAGHECDELTQRTMEACVAGRERIRQVSSFHGFVRGVARNVLYAHRREARRAARSVPIDGVELVGPRSHGALELWCERNKLHAALRMLDPQEQRIVHLHYWGQLSSAEIARCLGVSASSVRGRLARSRVRLSTHLEGVGGPRPCSS